MELISSGRSSGQEFDRQFLSAAADPDRYEEVIPRLTNYRNSEGELELHPILRCASCSGECHHDHEILAGLSVARRSLIRVAKQHEGETIKPESFLVTEHRLDATAASTYDTVLYSKVYGEQPCLVLQVADSHCLKNQPACSHYACRDPEKKYPSPTYPIDRQLDRYHNAVVHRPPYEQNRLNMKMTTNYIAETTEFRRGRRGSERLTGLDGLRIAISQIRRERVVGQAAA